MNQESKKVRAIDLMMVDLHTKNSQIRNEAREYECEDELEVLKLKLLNFLAKERDSILN